MLGCHDFCGYYDWTFHYLRQTHGQAAVHAYWAEAIGGESQRHYADAGRRKGLRGLYETWVQTGEDEQCDWTFTLDEDANVLRWDMRQCPSKGFLLEQDRYADEDYCDHCMGWMIPLLERVGVEIVAHEHNHCGQCWGEMRVKDKPARPLELAGDIRNDPRWQQGHLDRWSHGIKLPVLPGSAQRATDPVERLQAALGSVRRLLVLGRGPSACEPWAEQARAAADAVWVTDPTYASRDVFEGEPRAVLIGDRPEPARLDAVAQRWEATPPADRPVLLHAYLPGLPPVRWRDHGLPRPAPILPALVRAGLYRHQPRRPYPTSGVFLVLLAAALRLPTAVAGIDLYRHPSGRRYVTEKAGDRSAVWPSHHSEACELAHLELAAERGGEALRLHPLLEQRLQAAGDDKVTM